MMQFGQQSTKTGLPKTHAHIMMTQMNIKEGIKNLAKKETNNNHYCPKSKKT